MRPGIRYSNGEVVAPGDFLPAVERAFRFYPGLVADLYGGLVGGEACKKEPRTCDLSEGIVTDDVTGTITFHLVAPDPEFLYKLTLPFAYPVPPSTPDEQQAREGVPGTGPYMLEAPRTGEGLALVRNPHFHEWSPAQPDGYVDRIEWTFGVEPQAQVEAVAAGDADVAFDAMPRTGLEELFVRFAAQVHASPTPSTNFVVFDTTAPPFDDVQVRRALNFAVDRERVVQILGGCDPRASNSRRISRGTNPTARTRWTPDPEGRGRGSPRTWRRPKRSSVVQARRGCGSCSSIPPPSGLRGSLLGDYMVDLLHELGYRGSVRAMALGDFYSRGNEFQMALCWIRRDFPAASNFIVNKLTCGASFTPFVGVLRSANRCDDRPRDHDAGR